MSTPTTSASPQRFLETINAYHQTAAIKAALELNIFAAIASGASSPAAIADKCRAAERGVRILCDHLTILGFLSKDSDAYSLTLDTATFLVPGRPAYMGGILEFMFSPSLVDGFANLTQAVRQGGTALSEAGTMESEHPVWEKFARAMVPIMAAPAKLAAELLSIPSKPKVRVLDIAAGHGMFGIVLAQKHPNVELVSQDWANVVSVARENAQKMGLTDRHKTLPGDVFNIDWDGQYDVIMLPNFLHHFDEQTCVALLKRARGTLTEEGCVATIEFVPNEDRVSPPPSAAFALVMLATTAQGDAYRFSDYDRMFKAAGLPNNALTPLLPSAQSLIISRP
jgi:2-polyprenyl-3-methyl-5-hydroxy-6-metoxy-1,4-benzoquinol methylase